jgi:hypothetical protein
MFLTAKAQSLRKERKSFIYRRNFAPFAQDFAFFAVNVLVTYYIFGSADLKIRKNSWTEKNQFVDEDSIIIVQKLTAKLCAFGRMQIKQRISRENHFLFL